MKRERSFGISVGAVMAAFGAWWLYRGKFPAAAPVALGAGGLLLLLGLLVPRALAVPYRLWMRFADALSFVMTRVILSIVFFGVVTPIGVVRRLFGSDPLRRRAKVGAGSYWSDYPGRQADPKHYEKMY